MIERDAWLYLASLWDAPHAKLNDAYVIVAGRLTHCFGLCSCICELRSHLSCVRSGDDVAMLGKLKIDQQVASSMIDKIKLHAPPADIYDDFCWPTTAEFSSSRADFCRRMADLKAVAA